MRDDVVFQITRRQLRWSVLLVAAAAITFFIATPLRAQKIQERYDDTFKIAEEVGGVSIATSSDGRYVFVAGHKGILVSDDHGKTGTWVQTVRMK